MPRPSNTKLNVKFRQVSGLKSNWRINGLTLVLDDAQLEGCTFALKAAYQHAEAYITNSTFGQCNASGRFKVVLSDCNIDGSSLGSTLLNLNNSELHIINSTFQHIKVNKGPAVVKGVASEIKIHNTVFMENHGNAGLIKVSNKSILSVSKSTFKNNGQIFQVSGSLISVDSESSAIISESSFVANHATSGSCLFIKSDTTIHLENSKFESNSALKGGAIYVQGSLVKYTETLSKFQKEKTIDTNEESKNRNPFCIIKECTFRNNIANLDGGVIYIQSASVQISNSLIAHNYAHNNGGVVMAKERSSVNVRNCVFKENKVIPGGVVTIQNSVELNLDGSTFESLRSIDTQDVFIIHSANNSSVFVQNSKFNSKNQHKSSGLRGDIDSYVFSVLTATNFVSGTFTNCTFSNGAGIFAKNNTSVIVKNSRILDHDGREWSSPFYFSENSDLYLFNTNITNNNFINTLILIIAEFNSKVKMAGCFCSNNTFLANFLTANDAEVKITSSHFVYNSISNDFTPMALIYASDSLVSVETSVFRNNYLGNISPTWPVPPSILIFTASSVNVTACQFANNSAYSLLTGQGSGRNHYTFVKRTVFMPNYAVSLHLNSVQDIILENSIFEQILGVSAQVGINITNAETVRIKTSIFSSAMYFHQYGVFPQAVQIYSLRSNFTNGSSFVETDSPHFLEKAKAIGLLRTDPRVIVQQVESSYTSCTYIFISVPCHVLVVFTFV